MILKLFCVDFNLFTSLPSHVSSDYDAFFFFSLNNRL